MSKIKICPSMMCADFSNLKSEVEVLDAAGTDVFHMDIMDGSFVPNFGMGLQDYKLVRKMTNKLMDVHLMIVNPSKYIRLFSELGADIIYFHPEGDNQPARTAMMIKEVGCKVGVAINPGTSIESVRELLCLADYVLVMTVNPGFAGQMYLEYVEQKIQKLITMKKTYDFSLSVDGAISPERIKKLSKLGVDNFILGTSALFGKNKNYQQLIYGYKNGDLK